MAISDFLTREELKEFEDLKRQILSSRSIKEIEKLTEELHKLIDLAEKREKEFKDNKFKYSKEVENIG